MRIMKKISTLLLALTFLALAVVIAFNSRPNVEAQSASDAQRSAIVRVGPKLPSTCNPTGAAGPNVFHLTVTDGIKAPGIYRCSAANTWTLAASGGTVTSVAATLPNIFSLAGSPITTSGTLAITLATQSANRVWAGPTTGSAAAPTFRALVDADIPSTLAGHTITGGSVSTTTVQSTVTSALATTTPVDISTVSSAGDVIPYTPTQSATINAASMTGTGGRTIRLVVTTSGTSSYTITFGTNFKTTGTLATDTVSGKVFVVTFVSDGVNWNEVSRTTAM
jgi:hypothetical protein